MATSPATRSATQSGAAKDDVVGLNGDYTFTIAELLANDPGGAAKLDLNTQFFFGDAAPGGGIPSIEDQVEYLAAHGITAHVEDGKFVSFDIGEDATDFTYMVQIGNKGTWSQGDVEVNAPPAPVAHQGDLLFVENFDNYAINADYGDWGLVNLTSRPDHAWVTGDVDAAIAGNPSWFPVNGEIVHTEAFVGSIASTSGEFWLDTQNSPGGINITNWFHDGTGGAFQVSFDLGIHDFGAGVMEETPIDAMLNVLIDGKVVDSISYADVLAKTGGQTDVMAHFDVVVENAGNGDAFGNHLITFEDVTPSQGNYVGFALDTVQIHDWIV